MVPSSSQWTRYPTADIIVYPMSCYVIDQTVKKSRSTESGCRRNRTDQQTATTIKKSTAAADHEARVRRKTVIVRGCHVGNGYGHSKVPNHRSSTDLSSTAAASRCLPRNRRADRRPRHKSVGNGSDSHRHRRSDRRRTRPRRRRPVTSCGGLPQSPDQLFPAAHVDRDGDQHADAAREPDTCVVRRPRCSANVVLLAHGNRSLHVFAIQRTRTSVVHCGGAADAIAATAATAKGRRQHRGKSNAPAKYNYKLPGGPLPILNGGEPDDGKRKDRNTCPCPDDQRWYTAALDHLETIIEISVPLSRPDDDSDIICGYWRAPLPPPFLPLGKWYRTRDKVARQEERTSESPPPVAPYYPYKPVHVSGETAEQKRIYAVPDALRLFRGQQLRLHVPRTKVRTVTSPDGTTVTTTTTTYKCKFVPLARLHENGRFYGPILSSLPTVLSSLNLIYLP